MNGKGLKGGLLAFLARVLRLDAGSNCLGVLPRIEEALLRLSVSASSWGD